MKSSPAKTQSPSIARPIAHLLSGARSAVASTPAGAALPKPDSSVSREVASVAVTGYN
ncbi:MAG: hypothetical protein KA603_08775 [Azonexus sp.]|nr:hypothetical protein [Betaproteobacteria bacterium]MBK8918238.1 hypothetical protein [Betaproteobacteria bacterium]MBP6036212.1 hypothetical protein [Azonexus sp.]MBP6906735.1 hypothetical protein [Azonexus sp.]